MAEKPVAEKPVVKKSEKIAVFRVLAGLIIPVFQLFTRFVILDGDKMPRQGAFVLAPNHMTNIDPIVVGRAVWKLGRAPRFLAKASLFTVPVLGWFLRTSGQVPVERTGVVRGENPLAAADRIADAGHLVVIYPEGSLTRDPELWPMRGKFGAVRTALEADIPLVPVAHWGDQFITPRQGGRFRPIPRKTVTVKFGDPVDLSPFRGRQLDTATLNEATVLLMHAISALVGDLRGETPPAEIWDPVAHNQSEIGKF